MRVYCPVGDLVAGMAYLVRRLLENTANDSFLGDQQRGVPIERAAGGAVNASCPRRRYGARSGESAAA